MNYLNVYSANNPDLTQGNYLEVEFMTYINENKPAMRVFFCEKDPDTASY